MKFKVDKEHGYLVPEKKGDVVITTCPACKRHVDFTEEQLQEYSGNHLIIECPHCEKMCCFVCEYVYGV